MLLKINFLKWFLSYSPPFLSLIFHFSLSSLLHCASSLSFVLFHLVQAHLSGHRGPQQWLCQTEACSQLSEMHQSWWQTQWFGRCGYVVISNLGINTPRPPRTHTKPPWIHLASWKFASCYSGPLFFSWQVKTPTTTRSLKCSVTGALEISSR